MTGEGEGAGDGDQGDCEAGVRALRTRSGTYDKKEEKVRVELLVDAYKSSQVGLIQ